MNAEFRQSGRMHDLALVHRARSGEEAPFNQLVVKYRRRVVQIGMRYLHDPDDAEDVAQETFIRVHGALATFQGNSAFYTWLYRIAINTAITIRTVRSRYLGTLPSCIVGRTPGSDAVREPTDPDTPEEWALSDELCMHLHAAIETLPEPQRAAVLLRNFQGFSYRQIAVATGSPVGTIRSRLSRARGAIDRQIELRGHL